MNPGCCFAQLLMDPWTLHGLIPFDVIGQEFGKNVSSRMNKNESENAVNSWKLLLLPKRDPIDSMNKTEKAYNKTASMSSSSSGSLLDYDPRTTKLLQSAQLLTSLLSFTASLLIALMIRSKSDSFSQPSRRIIFAMSCADMLSSLGLFTGPFLVPNGAVQYTIGGPSGTIATCELNGFLFILGSSAAPMYTCALCSYYFCKINHNMPDREFAERIEKKIHIINISWSIVGALVALFTNIINSVPGGDFCYIGADPGCKENPDIECERGQHHDIYAMIISYLPNLLSFLGVISTMVLICAKVFSQEKNLLRNFVVKLFRVSLK